MPHAHILLFLSTEHKYPTPSHVDEVISASIPDEVNDPEYYKVVKEFMIHGPCGLANKKSSCMGNGRCTKHYPKKFTERTTIDKDGYPIYLRPDNGRFVDKGGIVLDNRYVVPHNRHLLMKYRAHINVEWCNQSQAIKYLFKYINKGNDRVTASFYQSNPNQDGDGHLDEVKMYYDCRYISPIEATWRIFKFDIQFRDPPVERLSFHLEDEQNVIFPENEPLDEVLSKPSVRNSMFLQWMEANKIYEEARHLTYAQFPNKFVWDSRLRKWKPRKRGFCIGRLFSIPPGSGDLYYLRCLLNIVRGAQCYKDIMFVNGIQYNSYRDACYSLGLLDDDKEYIDGIIEASQWATAVSLRNLFATLMQSKSMSRPEYVWEHTWIYLSDDILYQRRRKLQQPGTV